MSRLLKETLPGSGVQGLWVGPGQWKGHQGLLASPPPRGVRAHNPVTFSVDPRDWLVSADQRWEQEAPRVLIRASHPPLPTGRVGIARAGVLGLSTGPHPRSAMRRGASKLGHQDMPGYVPAIVTPRLAPGPTPPEPQGRGQPRLPFLLDQLHSEFCSEHVLLLEANKQKHCHQIVAPGRPAAPGHPPASTMAS